MRQSTAEANLGYGLTTAHILYRMPDHLELLQEYIWQRYDTFPEFPVLGRSSTSGRRNSRGRSIRSPWRMPG